MPHDLTNQRVVVMGLGRFGGGVGVTRFLCQQGARVLVTDNADEAALAESLKKLSDLKFDTRLGEHVTADFTSADLIVVNPAVDRATNPYVQAAAEAGVPLTSEIELLVERLPNRWTTLAVTGTAGKSTTTAMIGHILAAHHGPDRVHVGGNLGGSLLPALHTIGRDDFIVLELSSFMLEHLDWSPHIAVVTNLSPNHLDRHGTMDAYEAAKKRILAHQTDKDFAILGPDVAHWDHLLQQAVIIPEAPLDVDLLVPGEHNRWNATHAAHAAACTSMDLEPASAAALLADFGGLPHRLQLVFEHNDIRFFNDSKSTTPDAAIRAIDCFDRQTTHLILGGADKGADLSELAHHAAEHAVSVYTIGDTGDTIADLVHGFADSQGYWCKVVRCGELERAVLEAIADARAGHVVLLSPGCASWDQFPNYEQRGRLFSEYVLRYQTEV